MNFDDNVMGGQTTTFGFSNFDPADLDTDNTINITFVIDVSPSIENYEDPLNEMFRGFLENVQKSHAADNVLVKIVRFSEKVEELNAFQPIKSIGLNQYEFRASGRSTALFAAVKTSIEKSIEYRETLENSGVNVKSLVFIITDGEDMASRSMGVDAADVKKILVDFKKAEKNAFSFETIMFGVGNAANFKKAQEDMGIEHLFKVGDTPEEIRTVMGGIISQSISRSNNAGVSAITF